MQEFILNHQWIIWLAIAWTIPWKGIALWKSARNGHKVWFTALFILNTLAILDILYIFIFGRKKEEQTYPADNKLENSEYRGSNGNGSYLIKGL